MAAAADPKDTKSKRREVRADRLVGREVLTANHRRLGRLEEIRIEQRASVRTVTEYVVGTAGLFERLGMGVRLIFGSTRRLGYLVRWDQLDISEPEHPRLLCSVDELRAAR